MRRRVWVLIVFALLRMAATFRVFSQTADEQTHVGAGLELLQQHTYWLHRDNPPLPRVIMAAAPWIAGLRIDMSKPDYSAKLHSVLYDRGSYKRNMMLIRLGNLLFFAIGAWAMWMWARRELGETGGLVALILFTMQPVLLGYSALATHEGPAVAATAVAMLAFSVWLDRQTIQTASMFALAFGVSILCKFSCIAFVPVACLAMLLSRLPLRRAATLLVAVAIVPLVIWAGYAFTTGTLGEISYVVDGYGAGFAHFAAQHRSLPLPAPAFFWGVASVMRQDRAGYPSYFAGEVSNHGWPLYFPATVALKSTLPFLALIALGLFFARRLFYASLAAGLLIVAVAMRSNLDIGLRYVLPAYVPLTFAATVAAIAMFRWSKAAKWTAIALIGIHCAVSLAAHPDYFPYFNALASPDPSYYLVDSNLDWGQDVIRLRSAVRRLHIDHLGVSLMGGADLVALQFPPAYPLNAFGRPLGWAAVSDHAYRMHGAAGGWDTLKGKPYTRIGKSIRLYHLPDQ